jgi:allantoate deiminase
VVAVAAEEMAALVERLGQVGAQPGGGIVRPVYGPAWVKARDTLAQMMTEAGLDVRVDPVGNVYGRLAGRAGGPVLLTGSHFDTVPFGGAYDGALGVLAGIAALRALRTQAGTPARTVEVVALCEEEGSRFHANFLGTRAIWGQITREDLEELRDHDGVTAAQAMAEAGGDPERLEEARRDDIASFLELHIEQGAKLERRGVDIGVVTGIVGLTQLEVEVTGRADHAGTTAMGDRSDALLAAAEVALAVEAAARDHADPAVGTVGWLQAHPGAANVVAGSARLSVDLRHPEAEKLQALVDDVTERAHSVVAPRGCSAQVTLAKHAPPHPMDEALRARLHQTATRLGYSAMDIPSGAGHDSQTMARFAPTAMLFVPSRDGRSHSPAEYTDPEAAAKGATVLATVLHDLAEG